MRILVADAKNPGASPGQIRQYMEALPSFSVSGQVTLAVCLSDNPATPSDVLDTLADWPQGKGRVTILTAVAGNPNTAESTLLKLAAGTDRKVLVAVGQNAHASPAVLMRLTEGKTLLTQGWLDPKIAQHPRVTPQILTILDEHQQTWRAAYVRQATRFAEEQAARCVKASPPIRPVDPSPAKDSDIER